MTATAWQRVEGWWRGILPMLVVACLLILALMPVHLPHAAAVKPQMLVMAVYFWAIHRPSAVPASAAFALGIAQDLMTAGPLGGSSLVLVVTLVAIRSQRRLLMGRPFLLIWAAFAPVAAAAAFADVLIYAASNAALPPLEGVWTRALITFSLYPPVAAILLQIHRMADQPA